MICRRCGTQINNDCVFCPDCGAAIIKNEEYTVADNDATMRANYSEEPTAIAQDNDDTVSAYDFDRTVASPEIRSAQSPGDFNGYYPDISPNYPDITPSSVTAKKKSAMPVIIGVLAVLLVAAVTAFIFKEDIVGAFEKETTAAERTRSSKNDEESGDSEGGFNFGNDNTHNTTITINYAAFDTLFEEATKETAPPITKIQENVVTEVSAKAEDLFADPPTISAADEAAVKPESKEEIVEYFNTAINSAKADSKSITSNYMIHAVAGEITGFPKAIDTVLGGTGDFISGFMGPDDSKANVTWTSAADKNAYFPVEGETWASKLTAADVKDAKIAEKNGQWIIRITTVADGKSANIKHGSGHAPKAFNVVLPAVINENIPSAVAKTFSIGTIQMNYPSSTVTITVDPETGNVIHANYILYWTINIALGDNTVVLPFSTENDYDINW